MSFWEVFTWPNVAFVLSFAIIFGAICFAAAYTIMHRLTRRITKIANQIATAGPNYEDCLLLITPMDSAEFAEEMNLDVEVIEERMVSGEIPATQIGDPPKWYTCRQYFFAYFLKIEGKPHCCDNGPRLSTSNPCEAGHSFDNCNIYVGEDFLKKEMQTWGGGLK